MCSFSFQFYAEWWEVIGNVELNSNAKLPGYVSAPLFLARNVIKTALVNDICEWFKNKIQKLSAICTSGVGTIIKQLFSIQSNQKNEIVSSNPEVKIQTYNRSD